MPVPSGPNSVPKRRPVLPRGSTLTCYQVRSTELGHARARRQLIDVPPLSKPLRHERPKRALDAL